MKITEVRLDKTISLGNHGFRKMGITAVIDEGENPVAVIEKAERLLDWEINKKERDAKYGELKGRLAEFADLNDAPADIKAWVAEYERRAAEFANLAGTEAIL